MKWKQCGSGPGQKHKVLSHHAPGETGENHKKHQAGHLSLGHTSVWDIDPAAQHQQLDQDVL